MNLQSRTFYTYSSCREPAERRFGQTGVQDVFFETFDAARDAILAIREAVSRDPGEEWSPQRIERIELRALSAPTIIALLNGDITAAIEHYEVVGIIE